MALCWCCGCCAFGLVLYPLLTGLTGSVAALVVHAAMAGIFTAGLGLVFFDILLATCPQRHTATYIALYQTTTYVATFAAPILGTVVAEALGYAPALFISSGCACAGAIMLVLLGVGGVALAQPQIAEPLSGRARGQRRREIESRFSPAGRKKQNIR